MSSWMLRTVDQGSVFARLDFRAKMIAAAAVTLVAFLWESPVLTALLLLAVTATALLAGVKPGYLRRVFTLLAPFYLFLLITQGFFAGELIRARTGQDLLTPLFSIPASWWLVGGATMTVEGVLYGLVVIFKTLSMVLVVPLVVFTTDVNAMVVGLVKAGIPYKVAFVFSATFRFFPLLFDEVQGIIEAQRLRGLAFEKMGPLRRARVYARIAVPLILGAIVKSQMTEVVLQSKAFSGSSDRTYLHEARFVLLDYAVLVASCLFLLVAGIAYFGFDVGRFAGPF
jgi:energy-coupling factor transport system permease protein